MNEDGGRKPGSGGISPIDTKVETQAEKVKRLQEAQELQLPVIKKLPEGVKPEATDVFRKGSLIPQFLKTVQQRIESSSVYQSFKIPGSDHIIHDQRDDKKDAGKHRDADHREGKKTDGKKGEGGGVFGRELHMREGKLQEIRERLYENYLGDKNQGFQGQQQQAGEPAAKRPLTAFEKMILERFERGVKVAKESEDGKAHFFEKSDSDWKSFFKKFLPRTLWRKTEVDNVKELIYRGLMSLKGSADSKMLVSDLIMTNGRIEKFIRFQILAEKFGLLPKMQPGNAVTAEALTQLVDAQTLKYLALASKHKGPEFTTGMEATKGLFATKKTEAHVAEQLGITLAGHETASHATSGRAKRRGLGGLMGDGNEVLDDQQGRFIPWWSWDRENRSGQRNWFVPVALITFLALMGIAAVLLLKHFSQ